MQTTNTGDIKNISKKEYIKNYASDEDFKKLKRAAIIGYVCVGISVALCTYIHVALSANMISNIIISFIMLFLILGVHIKKSTPCAIIFTIIAALNVVMGFIVDQRAEGLIPLAIGISMIKGIKSIDKSYKAFLEERTNSAAERINTDITR